MGETLRADHASESIAAGSAFELKRSVQKVESAPGSGWEHCIRLVGIRFDHDCAHSVQKITGWNGLDKTVQLRWHLVM